MYSLLTRREDMLLARAAAALPALPSLLASPPRRISRRASILFLSSVRTLH